MKLSLLPETLAVSRLTALEPWVLECPGFLSVTRTAEEVSVVCLESRVPPGTRAELGFRALKVEGPLDFSLTGILANLSGALASAKISLFALSTFDTDYLLVRQISLEAAMAALRRVGHQIE